MLKQIYRVLDRARTLAIIGMLAFVVLLCLAQVILRYFTSADLKPFAWGDEVIRLTCIWVVFLAASRGVRSGSHLSVDFFVNKYLPKQAQIIIQKLVLVLVVVAMGLLVWFGAQHAINVWPSSLQGLPISVGWFYAAIPVGSAFLLLEYLPILILGKSIDLESNAADAEKEGR